MKLGRLLGAENGWGGALGTVLLLSFGLGLTLFNVAALRDAARVKPEPRECSTWLANPSGARWVALSGCQLDLAARSQRPGGGTLVPLFAEDAGGRGVLVTSEQRLGEFDGGVISGWADLEPTGVVLEHGRQPRRVNVLVGLVVGLIAVALAVRSMFMRFLVDSDSTV